MVEIIDPRNTTPSHLKIKNIKVQYQRNITAGPVMPRLLVELAPVLQDRPRGVNSSYEKRKGVPSALVIESDELQEMVAALTRQLYLCYQVLDRRDLTHELADAERADDAWNNAVRTGPSDRWPPPFWPDK